MFVDLRALRNDRVTLVEKGSPHSLQVMESGKVLAAKNCSVSRTLFLANRVICDQISLFIAFLHFIITVVAWCQSGHRKS